MNKKFYLLIVTLFATMSFALTSCGDDNDEPDGAGAGNNSNYEETFKINGETFYYARNYRIEGMEFLGTRRVSLANYDLKNGDMFLSFNDVQNTPLKIDDLGMMLPDNQDYTIRIDGGLNVEDFNPERAETGEVLSFKQAIRSQITGSNDPKYLLDAFNYFTVYDETANSWDGKIFTWRSKPQGTVKFISYNDDNGFITLEFKDVTLDAYQGSDYSDYPYTANSITINGRIVFTPETYN